MNIVAAAVVNYFKDAVIGNRQYKELSRSGISDGKQGGCIAASKPAAVSDRYFIIPQFIKVNTG